MTGALQEAKATNVPIPVHWSNGGWQTSPRVERLWSMRQRIAYPVGIYENN